MTKDRKNLIFLLVGVVVAVVFFAVNPPAAFSLEAWRVFGLLIPVIIIWATNAIPAGIASLLFLTLLCTFGLSSSSVAFSGFTNHLTWLMMGAFALSSAMQESGLSKRLSYFLLSKAKGMWFLVGCAYLCNVFMIAIPSSSARGKNLMRRFIR